MELLDPNVEELKMQITDGDDTETFRIPAIATTAEMPEVGAMTPPSLEEVHARRHEIIGPTYAKRSKYMSGLALNSVTYDEIMNRKQ